MFTNLGVNGFKKIVVKKKTKKGILDSTSHLTITLFPYGN